MKMKKINFIVFALILSCIVSCGVMPSNSENETSFSSESISIESEENSLLTSEVEIAGEKDTVVMGHDFEGEVKYFNSYPLNEDSVWIESGDTCFDKHNQQILEYWKEINGDKEITYSKNGIKSILRNEILTGVYLTSKEEVLTRLKKCQDEIKNLLLTYDAQETLKSAYYEQTCEKDGGNVEDIKIAKYYGKYNGKYIFEVNENNDLPVDITVNLGGYKIEYSSRSNVYVLDENGRLNTLYEAYSDGIITDDFGHLLYKYYWHVNNDGIAVIDCEVGSPSDDSVGAYVDYAIKRLQAYKKSLAEDESITYNKDEFGFEKIVFSAICDTLNLKDKGKIDLRFEQVKTDVKRFILPKDVNVKVCQQFPSYFLEVRRIEVSVDDVKVKFYFGEYDGNYILSFNQYSGRMIGPYINKWGYTFLEPIAEGKVADIVVWNEKDGLKYLQSWENSSEFEEKYAREVFIDHKWMYGGFIW